MQASDIVLEKTAGLALGCIVAACGAGNVAAAIAGSVVAGAGLVGVLQKEFRKYGLESSRVLAAVSRRTFDRLQRSATDLPTLFDLQEADRELSRHLEHCIPRRENLVVQTFDPEGFPAATTRLVMAELSLRAPHLFGLEGPDIAKLYAAEVIHAALLSSLETPEYFKVLEPRFALALHRHVAALEAQSTLILSNTEEIRRGQADIATELAELKRLLTSRGSIAMAQSQGLTEAQLEKLLCEFGLKNIPMEQAEALLLEAAQELTKLRLVLSRQEFDEVQWEKGRSASDCIAEGRFEEAKSLLLELSREDEEAASARHAQAARRYAQIAIIERSQARFVEAADLYSRAASLIVKNDVQAFKYRLEEAGCLFKYNDCFIGLGELRRAIGLSERHPPPQAEPSEKAAYYSTRANCLLTLSQRADGEEARSSLSRSIESFKTSLTFLDKRHDRVLWATTHDCLGCAYRLLAQRSSAQNAAEAFELAIASHKAAIEMLSGGQDDDAKRDALGNLGTAYQVLGRRAHESQSDAFFSEAIRYFEEAIATGDLADNSDDWATLKMNIGNTLAGRVERGGGPLMLTYLAEATRAYGDAASVFRPETNPMQFASVRNNLGNTLRIAGESMSEPAGVRLLQLSIEALREARDIRTFDSTPLLWAETTHNLGLAMLRSAERTGQPEEIRSVMPDLIAASDVFRRAGAEPYAAGTDALIAQLDELIVAECDEAHKADER